MRSRLRQVRGYVGLLLLGGGLLLHGQGPAPGQVHESGIVDRAYLNQDLFVPKGQVIHNATCVFCSVQVEGDVTGRVLVLFGNLSVNGEIQKTTVVVGGNAVFDGRARALRSTIVLFGNLVYESEEVLTGSAYVLGGHSSSYAARQSLRRRLAVSPKLLSTLVLLGLLAVLMAAFGAWQRRKAS